MTYYSLIDAFNNIITLPRTKIFSLNKYEKYINMHIQNGLYITVVIKFIFITTAQGQLLKDNNLYRLSIYVLEKYISPFK